MQASNISTGGSRSFAEVVKQGLHLGSMDGDLALEASSIASRLSSLRNIFIEQWNSSIGHGLLLCDWVPDQKGMVEEGLSQCECSQWQSFPQDLIKEGCDLVLKKVSGLSRE